MHSLDAWKNLAVRAILYEILLSGRKKAAALGNALHSGIFYPNSSING